MAAAFLTTLFFSISAVCAQRTTRTLGGITANFYRIVLGTVLLALWAHTFGTGFSGKACGWFFLSGVVGFGMGDLALYQALPRLGARLSVLLIQCVPVPLAAFVEWLWLGSVLSPMEIASALVILAGVTLALAPGGHLNLTRRDWILGMFFGVVAALGQGGGALLSRKAAAVARAAGETPPDGLTAAYQRIWGGLILAVVFWVVLRWRARPAPSSDGPAGQSMGPWIAVNALAGPVLGVGCYQWALMQKGAGIVLPIVALTPIVIIPFARYVEGDTPTPRSLAGALLAVAGAVAMALSAR